LPRHSLDTSREYDGKGKTQKGQILHSRLQQLCRLQTIQGIWVWQQERHQLASDLQKEQSQDDTTDTSHSDTELAEDLTLKDKVTDI